MPDRTGEGAMEIDIPEVKAELTATFHAYQEALAANNVAALDSFFLALPTSIRYGIGENLYGYAEIAAFRSSRLPVGLTSRLARTVITTYGRSFGVGATLFYRDSAPGRVGRLMQTWIRTESGWKIAAAHVSLIEDKH